MSATTTGKPVRPLRVAFVIEELSLGGAERVVVELARRLDRRRFLPQVICLRERGELAGELDAAEVPLLALGKRTRFAPTLPARLARVFRRERIDIVNTHLFTGNLWGTAGAVLAATPVVVTHHNVDVWKRRVHLTLDRLCGRFAGRIVVVSGAVERFYIEQARLPAAKMVVIPNGVSPEAFSFAERDALRVAVRRELGLPADATVAINIGRLVPQKGQEVLLDAFACLARDGRDIHLVIVGDGPDRRKLHDKAATLGLSAKAVFAGSRSDVGRLLTAADVFVLTSTREGHPLSIIEAMVGGLPIVATGVPGVTEVVEDGVTGMLVAPGDAEAVARAVSEMTSRSASGGLAAKMAAAGKKLALERFTVDRMVRAYEQVFEVVVGRAE